METVSRSLARRSIERSSAGREASYAREIARIIDATYRVIQRTGSFDPTMRDILKASRLSTDAFYRHFRSKDELMLALLADGRQRLVSYLEHRMAKATTPGGRIRAWIEGVLAQAKDPEAAERTRPFLAHRDRLAVEYPAEQHASIDALIDLLTVEVARLPGRPATDEREVRADSAAMYDVTFGALHRYLTQRTKPTPADVRHLVRFCLAAVGNEKR